jgi:putative tryptophan/tyrosine transport system substrate-binding protein
MLLDRRRQFVGTTRSDSVDFAFFNEAESAAHSVGLRLVAANVGGEGDFEAAFATAIREGADMLLVVPSIFFTNKRHRIVALAARHRLPAVYVSREFATAGGLISYGANQPEVYRQLGVYAGRVLGGQKPADMPVQLPTKFELVINLKTANITH